MRAPSARTLARASLVLAILGAVAMLFLPTVSMQSITVRDAFDGAGRTVTRSWQVSLLSSEGAWVVWLAAVPVLLAGAPIAFERTRARRVARIVSAVALTLGVLVSMLSVGVFFLPSAALMIAAAARADAASVPAPPVPTRPA